MPYTQQQWHDDTTTAPYGPINGTRLNYMEAGIGTAQTTAEAALAAGGGAGIGTALPLIDGTASAGVGTVSSAVDHVHPTDTSRAALASPTFTGTPAAPTAAANTNTTQLATTAFVIGQAYAPLASPTFSGTPSLPTGTTGVTQTAADNSTKLATTAYVDAKERAFLFGKAGAIGATETNAADFPFIVPFAATMKRCKVVLGAAASGAMTVQIRKASAPGTAVPSYADVTGFIATFASGSQIATFTLGTAVTTAEGDLLNFSCATGSGVNMMVEVVAT